EPSCPPSTGLKWARLRRPHSHRRWRRWSPSATCGPNTQRRARNSKLAGQAQLLCPWLDLAKPLQHRRRDVEIPAGACAETDSRLHVAMEVRSAGYAQIEFPRQSEILLDIGRLVIAVVNLDRAEARVPHFGY